MAEAIPVHCRLVTHHETVNIKFFLKIHDNVIRLGTKWLLEEQLIFDIKLWGIVHTRMVN